MWTPVVDALPPPAILVLLALVLLITGYHRAAALAVAALLVFAVEGTPHLLTAPLLVPATAAPDKPPAAIVVLASNLPELLDTSRTSPSLETLTRLRAAAALFRRTGLPILVSGARAADGPTPVAAQMALSLDTDFGVRASWAETTSTNLWQSAAATAAILRQAGINDIYLVAQPWELRLSLAVFRAAGLTVAPAPLPAAAKHALGWTALVVWTPAWLDSSLALCQWAGLACQALAPCVAWMERSKSDPS